MYFFSYDPVGSTNEKCGLSMGKVHIGWDQTMPYARKE